VPRVVVPPPLIFSLGASPRVLSLSSPPQAKVYEAWSCNPIWSRADYVSSTRVDQLRQSTGRPPPVFSPFSKLPPLREDNGPPVFPCRYPMEFV